MTCLVPTSLEGGEHVDLRNMVVAKISKFIVVCVGLLMTPVVLRAIFEPSAVTALWVVLAGAVVWRVNQIAVYVNDGWVTISNFFKTTHIPVWEAEVELGGDSSNLPLDEPRKTSKYGVF